MLENLPYYLLLGAFAGTIAGLLGVGGGLVIVPALAYLFQQQGMNDAVIMHMAIGTSLATIVFTSVASIRKHHQHGAVLWSVFSQLSPGIIIGALLGAAVADDISSSVLQNIFAVFVLIAALVMMLDVTPRPQRQLPAWTGMTLSGCAIGLVSAIIGIGGGTLTTPFLLWCNISMRNAIATSAACGLPIAAAGAAGFFIMGIDEKELPAWSSGYIFWPALLGVIAASILFAPLGAKLTHRLPVKVLKKIFALLLLVIGINMTGLA